MPNPAPNRILKYGEALNEAAAQLMAENGKVFVIGLGVPQGAAGTTNGLAEMFPGRALDAPISESALTGLAVGAAISGLRPIVYHEYVEFALLAADQIFTQAAKWNYMFGGHNPVPLTIRIGVGRWGTGPQHTQAFYSTFGAVRGLKAVIASSPKMAKGLLIAASRDNNPVVVLEPRWLYQLKQDVPEEMYEVPLDKAQIVKEGTDVTVVAYGDGVVDAIQALKLLPQDLSVELIDLVSLNPLDHETIHASIKKTGRLLTVDTTSDAFGVGSEIIAKAAQNSVGFKEAPRSVAAPNVPTPTSTALSEHWFPTKVDIANGILALCDRPPLDMKLSFEDLNTTPNFILE